MSRTLRRRRSTMNCCDTAWLSSFDSCSASSPGVARRLISVPALAACVADALFAGSLVDFSGEFSVDCSTGSSDFSTDSSNFSTDSIRSVDCMRTFRLFESVRIDDSVFRTSVACWLMLCVERREKRYGEIAMHQEGEIRRRVLLSQHVSRADVSHPGGDVYVGERVRRDCCRCSDSG